MKVKKITHDKISNPIPFIALEEGAVFMFPDKDDEYYIKITPMYTMFMLDSYFQPDSKIRQGLGKARNCMKIRVAGDKHVDPYSSSAVMKLYDHVDQHTKVIPVDAELLVIY